LYLIQVFILIFMLFLLHHFLLFKLICH
jgi:hypothetical protein